MVFRKMVYAKALKLIITKENATSIILRNPTHPKTEMAMSMW